MEGKDMQAKVKHSTSAILNKQFNIDFKGYSAIEVDTFLDEIITDTMVYVDTIKQLNQQVEQLRLQNEQLQQQLMQANGSLQALKDTPSNSNADVIKRIARLEALLDQKLND